MGFEVVWTEPALDDFEGIARYLALRSLRGADSVRIAILDHVGILSQFPFIGPVHLSDPTGLTREIVCGSYRIFYRVEEPANKVYILSVWHSARSEPELPD